MARKKEPPKPKKPAMDAYFENAGIVEEELITETLEKNYLPYAMSVIISRALPEIDGFKPSHRKLLYTMYKMGLINGARTKSANVVGQTMRLNPHGDAAIYETMVRLTRANESLLHPYVDSKGNFGKQYSRDMAYAAARYTEVKLAPICNELFRDIDKETVDFVPNYDNTMPEPSLLPAAFPSVLVNANMGIAVSMASNICPFNLQEICDTCIALMKNPDHDILTTLKGPDFPGGGFLLYDEDELRKIYETGRGSVKLRAKWNFDKASGCIEVTEIPYTTTLEAIKDKITELAKLGKLREVTYARDEIDVNGFRLAIDVKRGTDPDKLMQKLFRMTPLQDSFSCNFNILIGSVPRVMGVREILSEWTAFREECVKRRIYFDLNKKKERLHLLLGLKKILLDIDKAIAIIRHTEEETKVVPNLMEGFSIDEIQAEYVAEIKLRHLNRQYILSRIEDVDKLKDEIAEMEDTLSKPEKIRRIIIAELKETAKKYGQPRKTMFYHATEEDNGPAEDDTPDYPVHVFLSREGYFKKITPQSLRMSGEQKLKEGDSMAQQALVTNKTELLFFTTACQTYKTRAAGFDDTKASVLGEYIPAKLGFDEGEQVCGMICTTDYSGSLLFIFENGKAAKVPLSAYATKTNRKKLANAYSDKSPLVKLLFLPEDTDVFIRSSGNRGVLVHTSEIAEKTTRSTQGVQVMTLKGKHIVAAAELPEGERLEAIQSFRVKSIPAAGKLTKDLEEANQMSLL
ncbi:MAG: topoisomerase IV [Oscillospiraceae bacterium]|nr:topoisomerase IV [Ruminococcus sp.]MBQ7013738.1 topoisomerase IV [Oscillospiraceae bacterium]